MLTMLRKPIRGQDEIIVGRFITVRIFDVTKNRVVIGIDAPEGVEIIRGELIKEYEDAPQKQSDSDKTRNCLHERNQKQ